MAKGKKEKLGLMSRKMMLLRSRTASRGSVNGSGTPRSQGSFDVDFILSSPVLQDVGNLAPEQPEHLQLPELDRRSASPGSSSSDVSGMTSFLARYAKPDGTSDDELYEGEGSPAIARWDSNVDQEPDLDTERRKQRQDEYNSAILSKRAEQILANAKKRLNVMEGNLRGARDLVAPLTAANLKRATSLGSAHYMPTHGRRYVPDGYDYNAPVLPSSRRLHSQTSSPMIGRDYQGHTRGFSETELPERPYTALEHCVGARAVRLAPRVQTASPLRGSRSYDSLGGSSGIGFGAGCDRPLHHARDSPDSNYLEPLAEAEEGRRSNRNSRNAAEEAANNGLGIYRSSSRTSDLREQMSTLKGKISTLKERAREDSLRRQSQAHLRDSSPLNNASAAAPEFCYTSSNSYGSPTLDANEVLGRTSKSNSASSSPTPQACENGMRVTGSRNAFAEQATSSQQHGVRQARMIEIMAAKTPDSRFQMKVAEASQSQPEAVHRRTPSGTAIVDSARNRYSHHQQYGSESAPAAYESEDDDCLGIPSPDSVHEQRDPSQYPFMVTHDIGDDYAPSEDEDSVYEDAQYEQKPVVAHEDREDAFDYEHFFLHSALGTYSNGRRGSSSSEDSMSSVETAKGPALTSEDSEDDFSQESALWPPPTPETPAKLKEIERNLHRRALSDESISTLATYATADEDPADHYSVSPIDGPQRKLGSLDRSPRSPSEDDTRFLPKPQIPRSIGDRHPSQPVSRPSSRPGTAVRRAVRRDSGSDRADSGVGISHRSASSIDSQRPLPNSFTSKPTASHSSTNAITSPSTSPLRKDVRQDPVSVAVNALLAAEGRQLGLRNKAVVFGVVESLRKVVNQLQQEDEASYESRVLRRRLDEAKADLDGHGLS
ncbi:hypothetical protein DOTSEDRAFT_68324 [Dothistroma septosporum NZE10]|uniref:Uncharacterized protein n=1 Tax=Dothistroma septosporum (strain NZE10 / CBS 128990) TaxID=675120 RepID=N1Q4H3_DOTSN|nr:hypothetical protein DOTSEDRAFT_68324 [Dothistroma septosporum NZE10]